MTIAALLLLSGASISLVTQSPVAATETTTSIEIDRYRSQGYTGIDKFLKMNGAELARLRTQTDNPRWQELNTTLDRICKQRDCEASRLYWYTDFDKKPRSIHITKLNLPISKLIGNKI